MKKLNLNKYDGDPNSIYLFSASFIDDQELFLEKKFQGQFIPISLKKSDFLKKHEMVISVFNKYLPQIADYLNTQNKLNYSLKFWHPFLALWMVTVIDNFIDKKMKLEIFFDNIDENLQIELLECDNDFIFEDDQSFNFGHATSTMFEHLFTSMIFEYLPRSGHVISRKNIDRVLINFSADNKKTSSLFFKNRVEHIAGFNKLEGKIISFLLNIYSCFPQKFPVEDKNFIVDVPLADSVDWMKIFKKMMPKSYLCLDLSNIHFPFTNGAVIFTTYKSPLEKRALVGLMREKGIKVYMAQHGSNYGDQLTVTRNYITEYLLDGFISWGWATHSNHPANIIALPSPIISKLKWRRFLLPHKRSKIILISSVYAPNDAAGSFETAEFYPEYFQNICHFLDGLNDEAKNNFYYRPRLTHGETTFNNALVSLITKRYPWVKILHGSLDREMLNATITIHDNFGSALQKSLVLCPISLFFWRKNSFYLNSELENVFKELEDQKGYFDSGKLAAIEVNRIVLSGEKAHKLCNGHKRLKDTFFKTSFFPLWAWIKSLRKL
ncbi:MAG: hypothetical protein WC635_16010 [Bacteriovorax sp.]|jgi:hypothetical protein